MSRPRKGPRLERLPGKENWYIKDGTIRTTNGRSFLASTGTTDDEAAQCALASYIASKSVPRQPTIAKLLDMRMDDLKINRAGRVKDTVYKHTMLNRHFGRLKPEQLTLPLINAFRLELSHVPAMLKSYLVELKTTLQLAKKHNVVEKVPAIDIPQSGPPRDRYLTKEEAERLWNAVQSAHLKLFIHLALVTGARKGAILALTWDRVDMINGRLDFNEPGKAITNKRRPQSPITEETVRLLQEAKEFAETDHVIEYNGKRLQDIKKSFKRAALKAGFSDVTAHTLKHTAISWLAQEGFSPEKISALTATSPEIVRRIYQKFSPEHLEEEANCLSKMISFSSQLVKPVQHPTIQEVPK